MDLLVSVIIPVYNVQMFLQECINSIINQTYKNLEIIIVDDGSTDASSVICDKYFSKDSRIQVFHTVNRGLSAARNLGLSKCKGDFVFFADSDDVVEIDAIEILLNKALVNDADLVIGKYRFLETDGNLIDPNENYSETDVIISQGEFWNYVNKYNSAVVVWTKLYKKSILSNVTFPEGLIHEDHYVLPDIISQTSKIVCISDYVYQYRKNNNSLMRSKFSFKHIDAIKAFQHDIEYLLENGYSFATIEYCQRGMRLLAKIKVTLKLSSAEQEIFDQNYLLLKNTVYKVSFRKGKEKIQAYLFTHNFNIYARLHSMKARNQ